MVNPLLFLNDLPQTLHVVNCALAGGSGESDRPVPEASGDKTAGFGVLSGVVTR